MFDVERLHFLIKRSGVTVMQWSEVLDLIRQGTTLQLQFLKGVESEAELGPLIVAMGNTQGGVIVVGIDIKNYHLVGTSITEASLSEMIQSLCRPFFEIDVQKIKRDDRYLCVITVPEFSQKPTAYNSRYYSLSLDAPFHPISFIPENIPEFSVVTTPKISESIQENSVPDVLPEPKIFHINEPQATSIISLNKRQNRAMSHLKRHRTISNKVYRQLFSVSHKTAHLELVELVDKGVLQSQGAGRSTCYRLVTPV